MGKIRLRRGEVSSIVLRTTEPGCRAVFLVEAHGAGEQRKVQELFDALAELAEVAQLCEGTIMAYALQLHPERCGCPPSALFSKIESALKEEFTFSLVERSFNDVIFHLVQSLCEDSGGLMQPVPRCGICNEPEPFPTRVTMRDANGRGLIEACYCVRCTSQQADPSDREFLVSLLSADRRGFHGIREADLVEWPADLDADIPLPTYRIAS
jgi:hypothetical protein